MRDAAVCCNSSSTFSFGYSFFSLWIISYNVNQQFLLLVTGGVGFLAVGENLPRPKGVSL